MINEQTCETLKKMKLTAMADELVNQLTDKNAYSNLGFAGTVGRVERCKRMWLVKENIGKLQEGRFAHSG